MAAGVMLFAGPVDLQKKEIRNPLAHILAADPGSPVEGQFFYDSALQTWKWRGSAAWFNARARGDHTGTQLAATISDFAATTILSRLDQFAVPTASVNLNSQKIINLLAPTGDTDAANKLYVDNVARGMDWKGSVRAATTANVTLSAPQTIDGVAVIANDRVLVKNQTTAADNGIYVVNAGAWTRAEDANISAEVTAGMAMLVEEGTVNADQQWILTTNQAITLGTTALTFAQLSGGGGGFTVAGAGLTSAGSTVDVIAAAGGGISVAADSVSVDTAVVVRKFAIANTATTSQVVTHNLNTRDVNVAVVATATPWGHVFVDWEATSVNTVTVYFAVAPTAGDYRIVVHG